MKKFLLIFGTRPEAIKFAPLVKAMQEFPEIFDTKICVTGQHQKMLDQVLEFFGIKPDFDLKLMKPNQTLYDISANGLIALKELLLNSYSPDYIIVQGDTTTAMIGALAAFYEKIPVIHLEAGLRSNDKYSPFPEEVNRKIIASIAEYHLAPTEKAKHNLLLEGAKEDNIIMCGNTVIDALFLGIDKIRLTKDLEFKNWFNFLDLNKKIILVTGHRRENFGQPFSDICSALKKLAFEYPEIQIVYPVHLNPNVQKPVMQMLESVPNIFLIAPLDYSQLIWLMDKSYFVMTDSGGIQEEAPALGKPVLVMREVTERTEGIDSGTAKLVGTNENKILEFARLLLSSPDFYKSMANAVNPYGDGTSSTQITNYFKSILINQ